MFDPKGRRWTLHGVQRRPDPGGRCHFRVTLACGDEVSELHLEAGQLLDYHAFREHVLQTCGRLVRFPSVEGAPDPAVAWLDLVEASMPDEPLRRPAAGFRPSPPPRHRAPEDAVPATADIGGGD